MKTKIIGIAVLALGAGASVTAATVSAPSVTAASEPISGIVREAEAYASSDPLAEKGMRAVIRACMATKGFDYTPPDSGFALDLNGALGFKKLTVDDAKASGYATTGPQGPTEPDPTSPEGLLFADLAFNTALKGDPETVPAKATASTGTRTSSGGCGGEAMTEIYGSPENYMLATGIALNSLLPASMAAAGDPGTAMAVQSWASCMKESPYSSYANPFAASQAGISAGGQEEFRIAVTDAVCRDKTGFHAALDAVLDKYLTTRMQELAPEIEKVREIRRTAAANSEAFASSAEGR